MDYTTSDIENIINEVSGHKAEAEGLIDEVEGFKTEAEDFKDEAEGFKNEAEDFRDEAEEYKDETKKISDTSNEKLINIEKIQTKSESALASSIKHEEKLHEIITKANNNLNQISGGSITKEDGTEEVIVGIKKEAEITVSNFTTSLNDLLSKYDARLQGASTSLELSETFKIEEDKHNKYSIFYNIMLIVFILSLGCMLFFAGLDSKLFAKTDIKEIYSHILALLPFSTIMLYGIIHFSNRRAESAKIAEIYKHKKVTAQSYIGYKKSIENLEDDLGDEDKNLMKKHMANLLTIINEDPSIHLKTKGENHPFLDVMNNILPKNKKTTNSESN